MSDLALRVDNGECCSACHRESPGVLGKPVLCGECRDVLYTFKSNQRCKTCRWWGQQYGVHAPGMRRCGHYQVRQFDVSIPEDQHATLLTFIADEDGVAAASGPDFGCVHWEQTGWLKTKDMSYGDQCAGRDTMQDDAASWRKLCELASHGTGFLQPTAIKFEKGGFGISVRRDPGGFKADTLAEAVDKAHKEIFDG